MGKQTDTRTQQARSLVAAIKTHTSEIDQRFEQRYGHLLSEEQRKQLGSPSVLLTAIALAMQSASDTLAEATARHEQELADDEPPRRHRDEATSGLIELLVRIRKSVDSAYGAPGLAALGYSGRTPTDSPGALSLGRLVLAHLEQNQLASLQPLDEAIELKPKAWIKSLKTLLSQLDASLDDVAREAREAQATLSKKNAALEDYDHTAGRGGDLIWGLLRAVDMDDAADRLIPSRHHGAQDSEPVQDPPPQPPES